MGGCVLSHIDLKGIRQPRALLCVEVTEMFDQQLYDKIFVDINAADHDAFSDLSVQVGA